MTHPPEVSGYRTDHRPCARGCTVWRKHLPSCNNQDECRGCLPRTAEYGHLCYSCHRRLVDHLMNVSGQVELLRLMAGLIGEQQLTAETTAKISTMWRTDDNQTMRTLYAKTQMTAFAATEPYRIACHDAEVEIMDRLATWAVHLVNDHALTCSEDYTPGAYSAWLRRHLERLEQRPGIGDELESFCETMSQAHSLAPWRQQVARLRGIPCPTCATTALVMQGGESDVTCLHCDATMSHERYGIWTRVLADEQKERTG